MTKDISVQEMQEHFADHIEEVRRGVTLRLIDGDKFVAVISPSADDFFVHVPDPALGRLGDWTPPSLGLDWDPVDELIAERDRYR
jgi:antitoxin (DNA-binding transcriptional repressor) of toxin-antitoxin stability system